MMPLAIETNQLTKQFKNQLAVNDLNLAIKKGEVYGFLGKNGAGKSTTIKMLLGLIKPSKGDIQLLGKSLNESDTLLQIGSLVETPGFYENLNAVENLYIFEKLYGLNRENAVIKALSQLGLDHAKHKLVREFSVGMKQRLGIALAILNDPEVLILDEPINGLDPSGIKQIRQFIRQLSEERDITIFISSHLLSEIELVVDRFGIIHDGSLIDEMTISDLQKRNRKFLELNVSDDAKTTRLIEEVFKIQDYKVVESGVIRIFSDLEKSAEINKRCVSEGVDVKQLFFSKDNLENYFMDLTED